MRYGVQPHDSEAEARAVNNAQPLTLATMLKHERVLLRAMKSRVFFSGRRSR